MIFQDILKISGSILASIGGASIIILGCSSWLGKIWAARIQEKDKQQYQKELEELKANYVRDLEEKKSELEKRKILFNRYTENQFILYNDLYRSLYDLKIVGDRLWERAGKTNLKNFSQQLSKTKDSLEKSILLIEDNHYEQLTELLEAFSNYQIGKTRLIDLRNKPVDNYMDEEEISRIIRRNNIDRENYSSLIKEIGILFKKQIKLG
ncbi:putative phosphohydrolase [Paenibacillus xylanexedens]|uniref:hypothetical protein n=1 Tax=Paenibacillus xylanexedens TaxID=528191 RepID=UPI0020A03385|nr:hypothetical protein [Paenibacillus xylanexedens]MCP1425448.1 putative phosphohydrolase [Paenibacillus xylanexedens]